MVVVEGRLASIEANRQVLANIPDYVRTTDEPVVWVWRPHPHIAFGPRDVRHDRFERAVTVSQANGYQVIERSVGGHPVAHTGSTLVFLRAIPIDDPRVGLHERYEAVSGRLIDVFDELGVSLERGEPAGSFCPGEHSLSADGKIVGIAQRVSIDIAVVSGVIVHDAPDEIADILNQVYPILDLEFDPASVDSIVDAGGPDDFEHVSSSTSQALAESSMSVTTPEELIEPTT